MKKNLEKVFSSASIVVAVILIMLLIVTAFGGINFDDFQNDLVRGLVITLGILYILLSIATLVFVFIAADAANEIVLRSEQAGSVRASIGVVRKMVKETAALAEGVKCKKVALITNDYGVRLKVDIKIKDKDVTETELLVRSLLEDKFLGALGFKFHAIEIKVVELHSKYNVDRDAVDKKVEEKLAEIKEEAANAEALTTEENGTVTGGNEDVNAVEEVEEAGNVVVEDEANAEDFAESVIENADDTAEVETDTVDTTDEAEEIVDASDEKITE